MNIIKIAISVCFCITNIVYCHEDVTSSRPHIVLIIADDLGWNDVSFHGANQIPTPNIDALAYNGVILNRFYTMASCTPSRTALLTGQYPMRLGFQGIPIIAGENRHLPLDVEILPEKLKQLGYSTQLVGKWHLGSAYKNVTPTNRGFDYHFGYWHGYIGYFNHEARGNDMYGLDMHEMFEPQWSTQNQYATDLLTQKAEERISAHNDSTPLFLMLSHLAPHTGKDGSALEVPDVAENNKKFGYIQDEKRRIYAGMVDELDKSVGRTVEALSRKGMLDNTLIIFLSDNGAQTVGIHQNWGSNWPLRGMKFTVLEGGVRNVAVFYSSKLKRKGVISNELMHITDLMPTLYAAAGGDVSQLGKIDGVNQWPTLIAEGKSNRTEILLNIDEVNNSSGLIGESGRYKLVNGATVYETYDNYYGEDGRDCSNPSYDVSAVLQSPTNIAIGGNVTEGKVWEMRNASDLGDCRHLYKEYYSCTSDSLCLFDLKEDACETTNVADKFPQIVAKLSQTILEYRKQLQPQKIMSVDPKANPIFYNNSWDTWLDN